MIKLIRLLSLIGILIIVFNVGANAQGNKLVNIDFESGDIGGWSSWAVTIDVSNKENHTPGGLYSANPSLNVSDGPFEAGALIQEFEDFRPGDKLYANAWIKTNNLSGLNNSKVYALIKIEFWSGDDIIKTEESEKLTGTNDWKKVNLVAQVPPQTTMVKYLAFLYNEGGVGNKGEAYFDDTYLGTSPLLY
jgi:hypothetical protein